MRSAIVIASVLVALIVGTVVHLQATAGASTTSQSTTTEPVPVYLMGAAHTPGFNDTQWRTSLEVCNFSGVSRSYELAFLHRGESNTEPQLVELGLASGQCVNSPDVVVSVFGLEEAVGTIRLTADGDGIVAVARTYNDTPDGTFGTALGASPVDAAVVDGESAVLVHLAQSASETDGYRTNLDLLNVTDLEIDVEIALYSSAGSHLGTLSTTMMPFEYSQETRVFRQVTGDEVADGYAVIRTTTVGGALLTAASLVDNRTGDTTTIAASGVPNTERWLEPVNMGPVINSPGDEWYPVFARDGSFMIFVGRGRGGYGSGDLYISRFVDGEWQAPENMGPNVNTGGFESAPYLSADDRTLYFTSDGGGTAGSFDVWYCPLDDGVPEPRVRMESPLSTGALDCCPVISPDGNTLYICSNRAGGFGSLDVWVSQRVGGVWQQPVNLGDTVNTYAIDSPRWLSDDGTTLIIDSDRPGRLGGVDLWSVVKSGTEWLTPVNLGPPINSRFHEQGPGFIGNEGAIGGRIHFGSGRSGGYGGWDLWYSDFDTPIATAAAAAAGSGPVRVSAVTAIAPAAGSARTDEPVPTRSGCCSSAD
jgi:hypothetical protein